MEKRWRRDAEEEREESVEERVRAADSSNRVHILNAGCSKHSAAACPRAVRFERLRRYIRNDPPPPPPPPPPSLPFLPPVSVSVSLLSFFLLSQGEALSNRCPWNFISTPGMVNGPLIVVHNNRAEYNVGERTTRG